MITTDGWAERHVAAAVWQLEIGESGTPHYQGYIKFSQTRRLNWVRETIGFGGPHLEPAEGTDEECIRYCTKADTHVEGPYWFPSEEAVRGHRQGVRSDLAALAEAAKAGQSLVEISEICPATYIRNYRGIAHYRGLHNPAAVDRNTVEVVCLYGPSGVGKTHWARRTLGCPVFEPEVKKDQVWFNGYSGEKILLLDEYAGQLPIPVFNRICDPYAYQAPCKMAPYEPAQWTRVIVLTNLRPDAWYPVTHHDATQIQSVYRRVGYGPYLGTDPTRQYFEILTRADMEAWAAAQAPPQP